MRDTETELRLGNEDASFVSIPVFICDMKFNRR